MKPASSIQSLVRHELNASVKAFQVFDEQEQHCRGLLDDRSAFFLVAYTVKVEHLQFPKSGEWPQSLLLPSKTLERWDSHQSVPPSLLALPAPWGKAVCHESLLPPSPCREASKSAAR